MVYRIMKTENYRIVEIHWIDAETIGDSSWMDLTEALETAKISPPIMRTVGYLLIETSEFVALTDSLGPKECGHITKIPCSMIQVLNEICDMG